MWVLEDRFTDGRPPLEQVGVEFVTDVAPFETMKIRILNGGHAIIAYPSSLLGIEYAHEAMAHPLVGAFFDKVEREEVLPVVPDVPGTSTSDYLGLIRHRFANPRVEDTTHRLCFDGSNQSRGVTGWKNAGKTTLVGGLMRALRARETPAEWLTMDEVYGVVAQDTRFRSAFSDALEQLMAKGTAATLEAYLS